MRYHHHIIVFSLNIKLISLEQFHIFSFQRNFQVLELRRFDYHLGRIRVDFLEIVLEPEPVPIVSVANRKVMLRAHIVIGYWVNRCFADHRFVHPEYKGVEINHLAVLEKILCESSFEVWSEGCPIFKLDVEHDVRLTDDSRTKY